MLSGQNKKNKPRFCEDYSETSLHSETNSIRYKLQFSHRYTTTHVFHSYYNCAGHQKYKISISTIHQISNTYTQLTT